MYLRDLPKVQRVVLWARYIWFLRAYWGVLPGSLGTYLAAVKRELGLRMVEISFADTRIPIVNSAMQAAKRKTRTELREALLRKDARLKLPAFDGLTEWIYVNFWERTAWDWSGTLLKLLCLSVLLMDLFGFRESNLVRPRPNAEDHALRAGDITVVYRDSQGEKRSAVGGSPELHRIAPRQVMAVYLIVVSSKRSVEAVRKMFTHEDERGRRLIVVLMEWFQLSGVDKEDMLCTCHRTSEVNGRDYVYTLTSEILNQGIKVSAVANGYPAKHFSSCSLRKGMATREGLTGATDDEIAARGSWRSHTVMNRHYNFAIRLPRSEGDRAPIRQEELRGLLGPEFLVHG